MSAIASFIMSDWIRDTYPSEDTTNAIEDLKVFFDKSFDQNRVVYMSEKYELHRLVDILDELCKEKSETNGYVESVLSLCDVIDKKLKSIREKSERSMISLGNDYFLNIESLPVAVLFLKHMRQNNILYRRMSRKYMEKKYKEYQIDQNIPHKFSTILFALSWMHILSVHNSTYIMLNDQNKKFFG